MTHVFHFAHKIQYELVVTLNRVIPTYFISGTLVIFEND